MDLTEPTVMHRTEALAGVSYDVLNQLRKYLRSLNKNAHDDIAHIADGSIITITDELGEPIRFSVDWDIEINSYVVSGPEIRSE